MLKLFLVTLSFALAQSSFATSLLWQQTSAVVGLSENWGLYAEAQPRFYDGISRPQALLLRGAVLYKLNAQLKLGAGYGYTPQYLFFARNEHRFFQQAEWAYLNLVNRARIEERMIENTIGLSFRVRNRIHFNLMFGVVGGYVWDELFLNLNEKPRMVIGGFDQNRFSVGVRYRPLEQVTLEFGYLLQIIRTVNTRTNSYSGVLLNLSGNFW